MMHRPNHRPRRHHRESGLIDFTNSSEVGWPSSTQATSTTGTKAWTPAIVQELLIEGDCPAGLKELYCFRGRCFTIRTNGPKGGIPLGISCDCEAGWVGYRCQIMDAPHVSQDTPDDSPKLIARALGLSFAGIILFTILSVLAFAYYRRKKQLSGVSPFDSGNISEAFRDLKKKVGLRKSKTGSMCNLIKVDPGSVCDLIKIDACRTRNGTEKEALHIICQPKQPMPTWTQHHATVTTTVSGSPWSQVRQGSPAPKTIPHSPIVHPTSRPKTMTTASLWNGEAFL